MAVSVLVLGVSGCGDAQSTRASDDQTSPTPTEGTARDTGDWLLRFTTAEGADGEKSRAVFVSYNPKSGAASVRSLPPTTATDASPDEQVLLVDADHAWAIPDTGIARSESRTGRLTMYAVTGDAKKTLDIRAITGEPDLAAKAWAFDPTDADILRVVDADLGVWKVDLAAKTATRERTLATRSGWIFANGFDKATGEPFTESIDSDATDPAGNGDGDTRPVLRQGGTIVRYDGEALDGLPRPPCGFAGIFRFDDGDAWLFCADAPSVSAYRLGEDADAGWVAVGSASPKVVPASAAELTFVLPPVG